MNDKIFVVNPDYVIRNDGNRYLLYNRVAMKNASTHIRTFLHPLQAGFFSFFAQEPRTFKENISLISKKFDITEDEAKNFIAPFIENEKTQVLKFQKRKILIPKNFIIEISNLKETYKPLSFGNIKISDAQEVDLDTLSKFEDKP